MSYETLTDNTLSARQYSGWRIYTRIVDEKWQVEVISPLAIVGGLLKTQYPPTSGIPSGWPFNDEATALAHAKQYIDAVTS